MSPRRYSVGRSLGLTLSLSLVACTSEPPETEARIATLRPGVLSGETALLSLLLYPDGQARFEEARRRPFPYRMRRAESPGDGGFDHVIIVTHETHGPVRVPVSLGDAKDPVAPAQSAWAGGGSILRAPCFGAQTRFALVRADGEGERTLAQIEVGE